MVGDNSSRSCHARDHDQGIEVLRASLLTQEMALRALADSVDHRFWRSKDVLMRLLIGLMLWY